MEIQESKIADLTPDNANANRGTERGRRAVAESIERLGAGRSILVDKHGRIIAGNKTAEAAEAAGLEDALIVPTDGKRLVVVQRTDLDLTEGGAARELAYADNRASELGLDWDLEQIAADLEAGVELTGMFDAGELAALLGGESAAPDRERREIVGDPDALPEDVPARCAVGELWQLGRHRLLVGDSIDHDNIARLYGDEQVDIILTDPPYCSGGFQEAGRVKGSTTACKKAKIARDNLTTEGLEALLERAIGRIPSKGCCYAFCDWRQIFTVRRVIEALGYAYRALVVWDKESAGMGGPWRHQHELVCFGSRRTEPGWGQLGDVLRCKRSGNEHHTTEKPVELLRMLLRNTEGAIVADPFAGSGSSLIACEAEGRTWRGSELVPRYGDVILARWEALTRKTAQRLEAGRGDSSDT